MKRFTCLLILLSAFAVSASAENLGQRGSPPHALDDNYRMIPQFVFVDTSATLDTTNPAVTVFNETNVYLESVKVIVRDHRDWKLTIFHTSTVFNRNDTVVNAVKFRDIWDTAQGQYTLSAGVGLFASNYSDTLGYTLEYVPSHAEYFDQITIKAQRPPNPDTAQLRGYAIKYKRRE